MLSDPASATMLIKAWADTTLGGQTAASPLFRPLPSRPRENNGPTNPNSIDHYKSAIHGACIPPPATTQATITLHFNQEAVANCVAAAGPGAEPFEALAALLWTRISRIKDAGPGLADLSVCMDTRGALGLENSFFGNCMVFKKVAAQPRLHQELTEAAAAIREAVAGMGGDEVMELIEWLEREKCQNPPRMNGGNLVCVNLENVGAYAAVFEGGAAPLRASYYVEPVGGAGQVVILPSPQPGGRVAAVTLAEDEVRKLLEDAWIEGVAVAPTVVMGLSKKVA